MSEMDNNTQAFKDDYEAILPDGWAEGDDIFNEQSWGGSAAAEPETQPVEENPEMNLTEDETTPAIEQVEATEDEGKTLEEELQAAANAHKLRFKTQYNHEELDVELDEEDLPTVYQKSLALDSTREKLTKLSPAMKKAEQLRKAMGYDSVDDMLDSAATTFRQNQIDELVADGVHKAVAEDIIDRKMKTSGNLDDGFSFDSTEENNTEPKSEEPKKEEQTEPKAGGRNWSAEVAELMSARPQLRGKELPQSVQDRAVKGGVSLILAYLEYESEQNQAEITRLKQANRTHEQNAASAARAPVTGVTGGGATDTSPSDPFMDGFDSVFK